MMIMRGSHSSVLEEREDERAANVVHYWCSCYEISIKQVSRRRNLHTDTEKYYLKHFAKNMFS